MKNLYLIVGPSGSGKTTLANNLKTWYHLNPVVSYTTRPMRENEKNGVDHWFVSDEEFDNLGEMVAFTEFNGYRYGVTRDIIDKSDTYVIDPAGVDYLKAHDIGPRKVVVIGILTNLLTCINHMRGRGDNDNMIHSRIRNDEKAFEDFSAYCDFMVDGKLPELSVMEQTWAMMQYYEDENAVTLQDAISALREYVADDYECAEENYIREKLNQVLRDEQIIALGMDWMLK